MIVSRRNYINNGSYIHIYTYKRRILLLLACLRCSCSQTSLDLRNTILPENKPDVPVSCCCKFPLVFSLPVSSAAR